MKHRHDKCLKSSEEDINLAIKETGCPVHIAVRVFAGRLKSGKSYAQFVECVVRSDEMVREVANGSRMPSCIVSLSGPSDEEDEPLYHVMVEGQIFYRAKSIAKAYLVFFTAQNLLFLAPADGKRDISALVAAINNLCFQVTYQKNPLKKNFLTFVKQLDSFVGAEVMKDLANEKR